MAFFPVRPRLAPDEGASSAHDGRGLWMSEDRNPRPDRTQNRHFSLRPPSCRPAKGRRVRRNADGFRPVTPRLSSREQEDDSSQAELPIRGGSGGGCPAERLNKHRDDECRLQKTPSTSPAVRGPKCHATKRTTAGFFLGRVFDRPRLILTES
jgi:hypothetical protein